MFFVISSTNKVIDGDFFLVAVIDGVNRNKISRTEIRVQELKENKIEKFSACLVRKKFLDGVLLVFWTCLDGLIRNNSGTFLN